VTTDRRWFSLVLVLSAPLLSVVDVFIINVAMPAIRVGIHANEADLQLVIALYLLAYASLLVTGGRCGDFFGRKKVFLLGMLAFTMTSALCGLSNTPYQLNTARFLQGISAAFMVPQTVAFIQVLFPDQQERTRAIGWYGITLGLASMLGQFLGGYLTSGQFAIDGWRLIFFINVPIGLLAVVLGKLYLSETARATVAKFDWMGVLLLTSSLIFLILPLVQGREEGWPWWCVGLLALGIVMVTLFYQQQLHAKKRGTNPLIDMDVFRNRAFSIGVLAVTCCFMVHAAYLLMSALLFQNGLMLSPLQSGQYFVIWGGSMLLCSLWSMKLVSINGKRTVLFGTVLMFVSIAFQLHYFTTPLVHPKVLIVLLVLHGAGAGFTYSSLLNLTLRNVPLHFAGAASGIYSTAQQAAGALGIAIIGGLFFSALRGHTYQVAFADASLGNLFMLAIMIGLVRLLPTS